MIGYPKGKRHHAGEVGLNFGYSSSICSKNLSSAAAYLAFLFCLVFHDKNCPFGQEGFPPLPLSNPRLFPFPGENF